eukprot:TRINITY_DN1804_c0_g1_i2.p1 TRINITY_DN1804_c0_g1~~TRINITY_DN1804_c0_g1_i2.p1  ORF type:complete len:481 (-),score=114.99 TRINITY_DN1804_c0_g1_i2:125-1567(-)
MLRRAYSRLWKTPTPSGRKAPVYVRVPPKGHGKKTNYALLASPFALMGAGMVYDLHKNVIDGPMGHTPLMESTARETMQLVRMEEAEDAWQCMLYCSGLDSVVVRKGTPSMHCSTGVYSPLARGGVSWLSYLSPMYVCPVMRFVLPVHVRKESGTSYEVRIVQQLFLHQGQWMYGGAHLQYVSPAERSKKTPLKVPSVLWRALPRSEGCTHSVTGRPFPDAVQEGAVMVDPKERATAKTGGAQKDGGASGVRRDRIASFADEFKSLLGGDAKPKNPQKYREALNKLEHEKRRHRKLLNELELHGKGKGLKPQKVREVQDADDGENITVRVKRQRNAGEGSPVKATPSRKKPATVEKPAVVEKPAMVEKAKPAMVVNTKTSPRMAKYVQLQRLVMDKAVYEGLSGTMSNRQQWPEMRKLIDEGYDLRNGRLVPKRRRRSALKKSDAQKKPSRVTVRVRGEEEEEHEADEGVITPKRGRGQN